MADRLFALQVPTASLLLSVAMAAFGCSSATDSDGSDQGGTSPISLGQGGRNSGSGGSSASSGGGANAAGSGTAAVTACNDGLDNDGDGFVDGFDPECTGAADNDESSYATGIPGDNRDPKWQDCFFDGNSGAGDDHCRYSTDCLTGKLSPTDPACAITQTCVDFCQRLTPNGCDCFGCCTVELANGSSVNVTLSATCSIDKAGDAKACPRCTKTTQCGNDCGECELCAGKTAADLPASCTPDIPTDGNPPPPTHTCDNGEQVCGPGLPACTGTSSFCSFGCCMPIIR
ncbi:MAG TPA: hypothetical protein VFQ35_19270 [Polyangiaceae bacterium]|nr:hypothetical protein [Polyangiaceae bacterium]